MLGCTVQQEPEPVTEIGWFTPYVITPEFLNGQVKTLDQRTYRARLENGEIVQGERITLKERDSLGWSYDFTAHFDPEGMILSVDYLDDNAESYGYNAVETREGRYVRSEWIENDTLRQYSLFQYDDEGQLIRSETFRADVDTLMNSLSFETNENGLVIGGQWMNYLDEPDDSWSFEPDENGLVTYWERKNRDGNILSWGKMTYNEQGMATAMQIMRRDSTIIDNVIDYIEMDEKGNWLKAVYYKNGEPDGMDIRKIVYY
jgi:hypothetical protein